MPINSPVFYNAMQAERAERELAEVEREGWQVYAARWPCPWIWDDLEVAP